MSDGWAIHYGRGLRAFTFDQGRAPQLAATLHGTIHPMRYEMDLRKQLEEFEGRRKEAYPDPLTGGDPWTIGIGHTGPEVHQGLVWTDEQIDQAFDEDVKESIAGLKRHFPWFIDLNEARQAVLIGMAFQMGINGLLKFVNTMKAVQAGDYDAAADGMRASLWAKQTQKRAYALAEQMRTGDWA